MTNRHNRINRKPSAAELISRQLASTTGEKSAPVADSFAQAVGRRLEQRRIATVPGLPDQEPEPAWYDRAIEHHRRTEELRAEREAKRQAEQEAQLPTTTRLHNAISGRTGNSLPLNGAAVLRAALAGGTGTINSGNE